MDALGVSLADAEQALKLWEKAYRETKKAVRKSPIVSENNETVNNAVSDNQKFSLSESESILDELTAKEYNRLLSKKTVNISKQERAMLQSQRMSRYGGMDETQIPILDIFRIGYDNEINNGYEFYVRNKNLSDFDVVKRIKIKVEDYSIAREGYQNDRRSSETRISIGIETQGNGYGNGSNNTVHAGNQGAVSTDDSSSQTEAESVEAISAGESSADIRPGIKHSVAGADDILDENLRRRLQESADKYGVIPPGENPTRDVTVPKKTSETKRASMTIRTVLEAGVTPDMMVPAITEEVLNETFSYERKSNKVLQENAQEALYKDLTSQVRRTFVDILDDLRYNRPIPYK